MLLPVTFLAFGVTAHLVADPIENQSILIPGQHWKITFDAPPFKHQEESKDGAEYRFKGNSDGFNLSLFVESPQHQNGTHKDCYEFYWPQSARNPLIDQKSVKISHTDSFYRVEYFSGAGDAKLKNVNYYFVFAGKWIDLHISILYPAKGADDLIKRFDETLVYGREVN